MPAITLDPSEAEISPFADLIPPAPGGQELIGGLNGEQAFQRDSAGNVAPVPKAMATTIATPDVFADLIPPPARIGAVAFSGKDQTPFADLIPETAQALADTPGVEQIRSEPSYAEIIGEAMNPAGSLKALRDLKDRLLFHFTQKPDTYEEAAAKRDSTGGFPQYHPKIKPGDINATTPGGVLTRWAKRGAGALSDVVHGLVTPENAALALATGGLGTAGEAGKVINRLIAAGFSAQAADSAVKAEVRAQLLLPGSPEREAAHFEAASQLGVAVLAGAGALHEGAKSVEPDTNESILSTSTGDAADAIRQRSAETEIPRPTGSGQDQPQDGGGIRPSEQGIETSGARPEAQQTDATPEAQPVEAPPVASEILEPRGSVEPVNDWTTATAEPEAEPQIAEGILHEILQTKGRVTDAQLEALKSSQASHAPEPATPKKRRGRWKIPYSDQNDIIDFVMENGGIQPKGKAGRKKAEYDQWEELPSHYRQAIMRGTETPDNMANYAADAGLIKDAYPDTLREAIASAITARTQLRKQTVVQNRTLALSEKQGKAFEKGVLKPDTERQPVNSSNLKVGDTIGVGEDQFRVTDVDPDTMDVTLEDGRKYGVQQVKDGEVLYVDHADIKPPEENFAPEEPTAPKLQPGEDQGALPTGEVKTPEQLAAEKAAVDAELQRLQNKQDVRVGAAKPLRAAEDIRPESDMFEPTAQGDLMDQGQGMKLRKRAGEAGAIPLPNIPNLREPLGMDIGGKVNDLNMATTARQTKLTVSAREARRAERAIYKVAPKERTQNAMSIWREAAGDDNLIRQQLANAKTKWFKRAAADALKLTPEQKAMTLEAGKTWDILGRRGAQYGVLSNFRDNYVTHVWEVTKKLTGIGSSKLQDRFKFNKARTFDTFFDGDQANFKPKTLAIGRLLPGYIEEMNRVIADRQFIRDTSHAKSSEGTPLQIPKGNAKQVEAHEYVVSPVPKFHQSVYDTLQDAQAALQPGQTITKRRASTTFVNPRGFASAKDAAGNPIDQKGYKVLEDQPALHDWRWLSTDPAGNTVMMKSDISVHPELAKRIHSMMGESKLRRFYNDPTAKGLSVIPRAILRNLDTAGSTMKREMFGLIAMFHPVQEGTHGVGHWINPVSGFEDMSRPTADHIKAMNLGLILGPESRSSTKYLEGLGSQSTFVSQLARKYGGAVGRRASDLVDGYQHWLFNQYIPALKFKTYTHALERNMGRYAKELKRGEVTPDDVGMLTAEQMNAAYGHLNYALLDRSPTVQHLIQLGALAPDFLEARGRFAAQGVRGLVSKSGREQTTAIIRLALIQAGMAYTASQVFGGDYDIKHPFEVTIKGRTYTLRSVPEDLMRAFFSGSESTREFFSARANPLAQKAVQLYTGRNYRGEKVSIWDTLGETAANYIPIVARSFPGIRELTETSRNDPISPWERFLGSMGFKISRYSPVTKMQQAAHAWQKEQGLPVDTGVYPVSKYQQLRYALEDGDYGKAKEEFQKLKAAGMKSDKIASGFKESINHTFTNSQKNDDLFKKSLEPDDRKLFDLAIQRRKDILARYNKMSYPTAGGAR